MTEIHVVFPVLRGSRRFFIEKGRRWSVIEHLLLDAVSREPASAPDLAEESGLPRRVIVEAFIRLMRATWVEIAITTDGPVFRATAVGASKASLDQLPAATLIEPGWRSFAIEQITGGVFRARELDIRPASRLPTTNKDQEVIHIPASLSAEAQDLRAVFAAIEGEDEMIVGVDRRPEKLVERYAVVTVREGIIEGLPGRANPMLRLLIASKAKECSDALLKAKSDATTAAPEPVATPAPATEIAHEPVEAPHSIPALFDHEDVIIDGPEHSAALDKIMRNATERLIIHSTFITDTRAQAMMPALLHASGKGAKIDIMWGQDDVSGETSSSRAAAAGLQRAISDAGRSDAIRVHPFSTNSHAKIVIADNGRGGWLALLGSCNWLASDFKSFETSIRLREPALVGELISRLALLDRGRPGLWHELAIEMTVLGRRVESLPRAHGRTTPIRLLFSPDHAKLVLEARDRAKARIFVTSHRLGIAARPMTLLPILAAAKTSNITASAFFGRTTGAFSGADSAGLTREFAEDGVAIRPVHRPRLHAKVLGWDDDALSVSSFNWLSADPIDSARYREIGVLVEAPRIAENFIRRFEHARID